MAISTNQKPTIYRNLYENTDPGVVTQQTLDIEPKLVCDVDPTLNQHMVNVSSLVGSSKDDVVVIFLHPEQREPWLGPRDINRFYNEFPR